MASQVNINAVFSYHLIDVSAKSDYESYFSEPNEEVQRACDDIAPGQYPTPIRLFQKPEAKPSAKGDKQLPVYDVSDSDDDDDQMEVLVDTDTDTPSFGPSPISAQSSHSSIGSDRSTTNTFSVTRSPTAGGLGSPSKFQKVSYRNDYSPTRPSSSKPIDTDDAFSVPSTLISSFRDDSLDTSAKAAAALPTPPEGNTALKAFLAGAIGQDLDEFAICHDKVAVDLMDKEKISWGVQWELARGVIESQWTWDDVALKIGLLKGSNSKIAAHVRYIMHGKQPKPSDNAVWEELDREQAAIMENKDRGLGLMELWHGENNWYGGRIQQIAHIIVGENGNYKIRLKPMEKRRSYRLARFLGSRRVLQLKIPKDLVLKENKKIKGFMQHKFILCGRVFVPFFAKDSAAYLIETNENKDRKSMPYCGDKCRYSFKDIVNWHNRLDLNVDQVCYYYPYLIGVQLMVHRFLKPITKYSTRFALALSTSVPVIEFKEDNIIHIEDKVGKFQGTGKPPAEFILTDGCGWINEAGLRLIAKFLKYKGRPTAVQGRCEGGKGLWVLHPKDTCDEPKIWIRASQRKIVYQRPLHRAHKIFDLVSVSGPSTSVNLSKQSIMNLSENNVPHGTLVELMRQGLIDEVKPLLQWQGPQAMVILWAFINQSNSVSKTRLTRLTAGMSRALGLVAQEWRTEEIEVEKDEDLPVDNADIAMFTGRGLGGAPASLSELVLELIQAGFHPAEFALLKEKIRYLMTTTISNIVDKCSIPLPESMNPCDVLEEGEVYYRSSVAFIDAETQISQNTLIGDVLLGRYPIRLPSDIQKAKAVDRPELFNWTDVLIVSTKGKISFASNLSGGDIVFIVREKALVEPFINKDVKPVRPEWRDDFEKNPEIVKKFAERVSDMSPRDMQKAFADVLMLSLDDTKVGLYSGFQDFAIWKYGYGDNRSNRLAYIFNALLDSSKTGDRLKHGIFDKDKTQFGNPIPNFHDYQGDVRYIFHTLQSAGKDTGERLLQEFKDLIGTSTQEDKVLLHPYEFANEWALKSSDDFANPWRMLMFNDLTQIKKVVDDARRVYKEVVSRLRNDSASPVKKPPPKSKSGKPDPKARVYTLYNIPVEGVKIFPNVEEIKASYAYKLDPGFAFTVAFNRLCNIKANASTHGIAPCSRPFDEAKNIPSAYVRAIGRLTAADP
ncbi:hypothetical protein C0991_007027 [Blastosporella zonata]|nr:hypothetical protein C0991_007027 [Blastosporella zonata]